MKLPPGLCYGALGFALAFVALPLYVSLPAHYAQRFGTPLAALGAILLATRLLDALADPLIGRLADRWLRASSRRLMWRLGTAALLLALGFAGLFFPPAAVQGRLLLPWCALLLLCTYLAYSVLSVLHQAWGARLGGDTPTQARLNAWREGLALAGVLIASALASLVGPTATAGVLGLALALGLLLLARAPRGSAGTAEAEPPGLGLAWHTPGFTALLAVFALNGVAAAIPATLLLFFVRDRLQTPQAEALYLLCYFLAAALALPLWLRLVRRIGAARAWALGMALAVSSFAWAAALGPGDVVGFVCVCLGSGIALGADLTLPAALLTRLIQQAGLAGRAEGSFFGWWNAANKLNLALAAGLALPLLQALGYTPGQRNADGLQALTLAYCLLPCLLKCAAVALLYRFWIHPHAEVNACPLPR